VADEVKIGAEFEARQAVRRAVPVKREFSVSLRDTTGADVLTL
jgi:hypothetical protein